MWYLSWEYVDYIFAKEESNAIKEGESRAPLRKGVCELIRFQSENRDYDFAVLWFLMLWVGYSF